MTADYIAWLALQQQAFIYNKDNIKAGEKYRRTHPVTH
jgi:hypothetical protein